MLDTSSYKKGLWAEWVVAFYFWLRGYRLLARRFKTKTGEIDLIVRKGSAIVFVEVKARKKIDEGLEAVTSHNQRRIINAARLYLQQSPDLLALDMRFDVVVVTGLVKCHHVRFAFSE